MDFGVCAKKRVNFKIYRTNKFKNVTEASVTKADKKFISFLLENIGKILFI
jgi:hypothetical protein